MNTKVAKTTNKYDELLVKFLGENFKKRDLSKPKIEGDFICATEGNIALKFPKELSDIKEFSNKSFTFDALDKDLPTDSTKFIASEFTPTAEQLEKLTPRPVECSECEGSGEVECDYGHTHECPECECGLIQTAEVDVVSVGGISFQWQHFSLILETANSFNNGEGLWLKQDSTKRQVFIFGEARVYVMPIRDSGSFHKIKLGE